MGSRVGLTDIETCELSVGAIGLVVMRCNCWEGAACFVNFRHCVYFELSSGVFCKGLDGFAFIFSSSCLGSCTSTSEVKEVCCTSAPRIGDTGYNEVRQGSDMIPNSVSPDLQLPISPIRQNVSKNTKSLNKYPFFWILSPFRALTHFCIQLATTSGGG